MKYILLSIILAISSLDGWSQAADTRLFHGTVLDETGEPLIGATVKEEGTVNATATNVEGNYTLKLPVGKAVKLSISYVGYATAVIDVAPSQNNVKTTLSVSANNIDEIVVIGYGAAKKSSLTSSVEVISGDELIRIPAMNVDQTLAGQVAGLGVMTTTGDPASPKEATMSIRGNGDPLLVIDGVPRLGTTTSDGEMRLSDLNPDDSESISIL